MPRRVAAIAGWIAASAALVAGIALASVPLIAAALVAWLPATVALRAQAGRPEEGGRVRQIVGLLLVVAWAWVAASDGLGGPAAVLAAVGLLYAGLPVIAAAAGRRPRPRAGARPRGARRSP